MGEAETVRFDTCTDNRGRLRQPRLAILALFISARHGDHEATPTNRGGSNTMELNRRDFLKGSLAFGGVAALGGLAGCATPQQASNDSAKDAKPEKKSVPDSFGPRRRPVRAGDRRGRRHRRHQRAALRRHHRHRIHGRSDDGNEDSRSQEHRRGHSHRCHHHIDGRAKRCSRRHHERRR